MKLIKNAKSVSLKMTKEEWKNIGRQGGWIKEAKEDDKWIQKAVPESHHGEFTEYCKRKGHNGVTQECIDDAKKEGGKRADQAQFAENMRKINK